jgi:hypothetical protein
MTFNVALIGAGPSEFPLTLAISYPIKAVMAGTEYKA